MADCITFTVPGQIVAWQRAGNSGGAYYTQPKTKTYQSHIAWCAKAAQVKVIEGPVRLLVVAYMPIPAKTPKKLRAAMLEKSVRPETKPDCDNIIKTVADALNGIAYKDDKVVTDMAISKFYAEFVGIDVTVGPA